MVAMAESDVPRRRRRAVGPTGAPPASDEPSPELTELNEPRDRDEDDEERLLRDVPPHHGPV